MSPHTDYEEIQKAASMELHDEWSENVENVENHQFLKGNCEFFSVSYLSEMKTVSACSETLPYSSSYFLKLVSTLATIFCSGDI